MSELLRAGATSDNDLGTFVRRHGTIIEQFDHRSQDSGNVSWLVEAASRRLVVKSAGRPEPFDGDGHEPYLDHAGRVAAAPRGRARASRSRQRTSAGRTRLRASSTGPSTRRRPGGFRTSEHSLGRG